MKKLITVLGLAAVAGIHLLNEIEKQEHYEKNKDDDINSNTSNKDRTKIANRNLLLSKKEAYQEEMVVLQKEMARLHEVFMVAGRLTEAGQLDDLELKVKGKTLEESLKEKEDRISEIVKEIRKIEKILS